MHALLFRNWIHRVKGRDWYDMEWYIQKKVPLHLSHFLLRANNSGDWQDETISTIQLKNLLYQKIEAVDFNQIRADIERFINDPEKIAIWSPQYFKDLPEYLIIQE